MLNRIHTLFFALAASAYALAVPTPMRLLERYHSTDVINVGANTIGDLSTATLPGGQGTLTISGLYGNVNKAWLYWKGIEYVFPAGGFVGGNGNCDEAEIRFENQLLVGTLVASGGSVWGTSKNPIFVVKRRYSRKKCRYISTIYRLHFCHSCLA